jgi:hypothetical protein
MVSKINVLVFGCSLLLVSCAGRSAQPSVDAPAGFLPPPSLLPARSVSEFSELAAQSFDQAMPSNLVGNLVDVTLTFSPDYPPGTTDIEGLAYAIYQFNVTPAAAATGRLNLDWVDHTEDWFVGLANRNTDRWEWFASEPDDELALPLADAGDPSAILIAVAAVGSEEITLRKLRIGSTEPTVRLFDAAFNDSAAGPRPLALRLIAAAEDINGSIVNYRWNIDTSDPDFELNTGSENVLETVITKVGTFELGVRVTDDDGETAEATFTADTSGGFWRTKEISESSPVIEARHPCLAVIDGRPAIAFSQHDSGASQFSVQFKRSQDATGAGWGNLVEVSGTGAHFAPKMISSGGSPSKPLVVFHDDGPGSFILSRLANDVSGSQWTNPLAVVAEESGDFDLALIGNKPGVAYQTASPVNLNYVQAADTDVTAWGLQQIVDSTPEAAGSNPSLQATDLFRPSVAYEDVSNDLIRFAVSDDEDGENWSSFRILSGSAASSTPLLSTFSDGRAVCAYLTKAGGFKPAFTIANNSTGLNWPVAPFPGIVGIETPMLLGCAMTTADIPCIAYSTADLGIRFQLASDIQGLEWEGPESVFDGSTDQDSPGDIIVLPTGNVAVVWADVDTGQIMYSVYVDGT